MAVIEEKLAIPTPDGTANACAAHPEGRGPWPAVIMYMDAIGVRPALREMAKRLAQHGYYVLLPNLFYRQGPCEDMDFVKDQKRFMGYMKSLSTGMTMQDTAAFLSFLATRPEANANAMACFGYCMGGRMALAAAGHFPERLKAVGCFHGGGVATDAEDSPHRLADKMRARLYIGVAGIDPFLKPGETERLQQALEAAKVPHTLEVYPGVQHGFAVTDLPVYDHSAAERAWQALLDLLRATL